MINVLTPLGDPVDENGCGQTQLDDDNDGVFNFFDICPDTPEGTPVDPTGCPRVADEDFDGVEDSLDKCPGTPLGDTVDENGCGQTQLDDDNDGVKNFFDACPETPAGTTVDPRGCEIIIDTDLDGVADENDECPNTPFGEEADDKGCSATQKDDDNDGVNNLLDKCPDTPENTPVDSEGCVTDNATCAIIISSTPPSETVLCLDKPVDAWEASAQTNCADPNLSVNVSGLPTGLDFETNVTGNQVKLVFSGTPKEKGVFL